MSPPDHPDDAETVAGSTPTPDASVPRIGGRLAVPNAFSPDEVLAGRFRIVRFIAQGGMGEVYEAEDLELSGRVALKTIRSEIAEEVGSVDRFKREVHIARQVTHPNVCRIYDVFRHGGTTFLTMEFLQGETLADRLSRQRRFSTAEAMPIVSQVAAGLGAAHRAGVIHRDFKSANVMLVPEAAEEGGARAVVTDFGLARRSRGEDGSPAAATMTQGIAGTPAYMAPEQVEGGEITPATDIYALGVVLYEMVTGDRPFTGDTPLSIAVKRLKEAPSSPRAHIPDLDPRWEKTILRCLEPDPRDRFASAADVPRALAGESVAGGRRRKRATWAAVAALLLLAGALGYVFVRRHGREAGTRAKARRSVAVLGFKNLAGRPDAAWLSTALSEMLTTELSAGEKLRTVPGESIARMKSDLALPDADSYAKDTLARISQNIDAGYVVVGSYLAIVGAPVRVDLKLQDAAAGETIAAVSESGTETELADLVARAGSQLREKLGAGALTSGAAEAVKASLPSSPDAVRLYAEGLQKLHAFDSLQAAGLFEKAIAADSRHALSYAALATARSNLGDVRRARDAGEKAFKLSSGLSREDRLSVEAQYRAANKEWPKAIELYQELVRLFPDDLEYRLHLAGVQSDGGKGKEAMATVGALRSLPAPSRDDPRIDLAEAGAAYALGDAPRERDAARRAIEKARARGARLLEANALYHEGWALYVLGDLKASAAAGEKARSLYAAAGDEHGVAIVLADILGLVPYKEGGLEDAKRILEEGLAIARQTGDRRNEAACLNNLGLVAQAHGDLDELGRLLQQAIAVSRDIGDSVGNTIFVTNLGQLEMARGDLKSARKNLDEALSIARSGNDARGISMALGNRANVDLLDGDLKASLAELEECVRLGSSAPELLPANLMGMGLVLQERDDLIGARAQFEASLKAAHEVGDRWFETYAQLSLSSLEVEEGRAAEAETLAQKASEEAQRLNLVDLRVSAAATLSQARVAQKKAAQAQAAIDSARGLISGDFLTRQLFALEAARAAAATGRTSEGEARCTEVLHALTEHGFVGPRLGAALALGEIEIASGKTAAGRTRLERLEKEAKEKGFLLIARKASRTLSARE